VAQRERVKLYRIQSINIRFTITKQTTADTAVADEVIETGKRAL